MDDHPHATNNALDQAEQELLISTVSEIRALCEQQGRKQ